MNAKLILLAVAVAVIGAGALMMCDDSDAAAGDVLASGSCGTSLTYEVRSLNADDSQVELEISGNGAMEYWPGSTDGPWYPYHMKIVSAILPAGLTSISAYAFNQCTYLALTELPAGLTSIGRGAFDQCESLALTELPAGLTTISDYAFHECRSLALTELPAGITHINTGAFQQCRSLALTELPAGITYIGSNAFAYCSSLAITEIPATINSIGNGVFNNCPQLKTMTIHSLTPLGGWGLTKLEHITYTAYFDWTIQPSLAPQYTSRTTLKSITFADDRIPANALYGQDLDTLTITNASGPDILGIYTAPNVKATASALTVDGTAAHIVRLTDVAEAAELVDGGITANDVNVHWDTSPDGYATGEVDASPEVLVYPAGIHTSAPNQYAGLINAIPLIVIVAVVMAIVGTMIIRRD